MEICEIWRIFEKFIKQIWKRIIVYCYQNGLDALKIASKKVVHKAAEAMCILGNKIGDKIVKPKFS